MGNLLEIGVFGLEIGRSECRWRLDWETFSGISVSGDTRFSGSKRGKNKDCFVNKQYFFSKFPKILLDKGFKLSHRSFEGFFLFSVEPPLGRRLSHQGVDIPHSHQVPDAL